MSKPAPAQPPPDVRSPRMSRLLLAQVHPLWWVPLGAGLTAADYLTGPRCRPARIRSGRRGGAAWYSGAWIGVLMALLLPAVRLLSAEHLMPSFQRLEQYT